MWHIDAEIISLCFVLVIFFDMDFGRKSEPKDNMFKLIALSIVVAICFDILSTYAFMAYGEVSRTFFQLTNMGYFLLTTLLPYLWFVYGMFVVFKPKNKIKLIALLAGIPHFIYVIFLLINPWTELLYVLAPGNIYSRGILFDFLFVLFYGYSAATVVISVLCFRKNERVTAIILLVFPIIVGAATLLQNVMPGYLFTGASFTLVLLITYMFIQNRKATRDILTGVNNRDAFISLIERISKTNESGFVIAVSLKNFKLINQTFGQQIGDKLLRLVAEFLVSRTPNKICYRYAGDIFAMVIRKSEKEQTDKLLDVIIARFKKPFAIKNVEYMMECEIGAVCYPYEYETKNNSIIDAVDFAIAEAKKKESGQVVYFSDELVRTIKRHHDVAMSVSSALENETFEVHLQPVYNLKDARFNASEALLRLKDPILGYISPVEFIPIAEKSGQIVEITYFVIRKVCEFLKANEAKLESDFSVNINLSVIQFMQSGLSEKIKSIIETTGTSFTRINFELTESIMACNIDDIRMSMQELVDVGINFALDDYGQGYSNVSYLLNLPFKVVKLDKSIIDHASTNAQTVIALMDMFHSLGKFVVAEGVETFKQVTLLKAIQCNYIQGYYYAKPMPMADVIEFLEKN